MAAISPWLPCSAAIAARELWIMRVSIPGSDQGNLKRFGEGFAVFDDEDLFQHDASGEKAITTL